MEQRLRCVIINREELVIEHQLDADVLFLLENLYQYEVRVLNLDGKTGREEIAEVVKGAGYRMEEAILIAAEDETLKNGREIGLPTIAFFNQERKGQSYAGADILVEGFEEVDFYFLERIYQRKYKIPWRVIETKRTYLREMTVEDVDVLYEIYAQEGMTDFVEPLYEKKEDELAYTKAYIENMYEYFGYGIWLICDRYRDTIIGRAGLNNQEIEGNIELEMGYLIRKEYQKKGYAKEVCSAILDYAKEALDFERVNCLVEQENRISQNLLVKLGFLKKSDVNLNGKCMKRYVYLL